MMTGKELAAQRKEAGMTQAQLARAAGIGRHAVSYWETKSRVDRTSWAVRLMAEILNLPDYSTTNARASWAVRCDDIALFRLTARLTAISARRRVLCGAKTRQGTPCRCKSVPGKQRCKLHGGLSTGAKTAEGRERIAKAQRRRWARWQRQKAGSN